MHRALLVCNSRFGASSGLSNLHGPKMDGLLLRDALTDNDTGMFDRKQVTLIPEESVQHVSTAIESFFAAAEPDDTVLFYYSGHGLTRHQQLFLCTADTETQNPYSTAVPQSTISAIVSASFAAVKILILDCCHSGTLKGGDIAEALSGTGRYIIAAASGTDRASDGRERGEASPFTRVFAEALTTGADDRDGKGHVDLDDVYHYLERTPYEGPRPQRDFAGRGTAWIAKRSIAVNLASTGVDANGSAGLVRQADGEPPTTFSFMDALAPQGRYSPKRVSDFQATIRSQGTATPATELSPAEFLEHVGVMRESSLTNAGVLLFGDNPTALFPTSVVQCARFRGTTKTGALESSVIQGTLPEVIVQARDFVASHARIGEAPTSEGAFAETTYRFPMIAVREIIANAVVHRDYEAHDSCVQIHMFDDRLEIISPGRWGGAAAVPDGESLLGQLERRSQPRNFRLAWTLGMSRLVEGVGAGVPRSIADCLAAEAQEPAVSNDDQAVTVTIFPRPAQVTRVVTPGGPMPRYRQIADDLLQQIDAGQIGADGSPLPTESELRDRYEASRNTIRDAIKLLTARGVVETRSGQGTFVVPKLMPFVTKLARTSEDRADYFSEVTRTARTPKETAPRVEILSAGALADELRLDPDAMVVSRHQQRYIDDQPYSLQTTFYPMRLVEQGATYLLRAEDIRQGVMTYLEERLGIKEAGYRDRIVVRQPHANEQAFFGMRDEGSTAVFELSRVGFDSAGNPLRVTVTTYPADRNEFVMDVGDVPGELSP